MSDQPVSRDAMGGPAIMLLSAAIFGYFGFFAGMTVTTASGEVVLFWAILLWTLRGGAILFTISAMLTFVAPLVGNLIYAATSLLTALGLLAVGVMDLMDDQRAAAIPPLLAFIFAAWNGFGAWNGMREFMSARRGMA